MTWLKNMLSQYTESPKNPAYIASQGPLQNCAGDFWQMVWEQGVSEVIMLSLNDGIDVSMIFYSSARFSQSCAYLELIENFAHSRNGRTDKGIGIATIKINWPIICSVTSTGVVTVTGCITTTSFTWWASTLTTLTTLITSSGASISRTSRYHFYNSLSCFTLFVSVRGFAKWQLSPQNGKCRLLRVLLNSFSFVETVLCCFPCYFVIEKL